MGMAQSLRAAVWLYRRVFCIGFTLTNTAPYNGSGGAPTSYRPTKDIPCTHSSSTRYSASITGRPWPIEMLIGFSLADLVQDLYLKELKAYKPSPVKPSDAEGQVQKFTAPKAPRSPDEGDIAQELKAYDEQQVEVEGQAAEGEAVAEEDWFEEEEEEEEEAAH